MPVRLLFRERRRADLDDLLSGKHQRQRNKSPDHTRLLDTNESEPLHVEGLDDEFVRLALDDRDE